MFWIEVLHIFQPSCLSSRRKEGHTIQENLNVLLHPISVSNLYDNLDYLTSQSPTRLIPHNLICPEDM